MKPQKIKNLIQGSPEWHEFRSNGLGSSDASIISGHMPGNWDSLYGLCARKITNTNKIMRDFAIDRVTRGQELEPQARKAYTKLTKIKVTPECFISREFNWLRASLDGIDKSLSTILEIKCSGEKVYNKVADEGLVPEYYIPQVQHQMAVVPTALKVHFWMFDPVLGGILIEVPRDEEFIKELVEREEFVWNAIQNGKKLYSGQFGKPIPIKHDYKVLYNAKIEKEESKEPAQTQTQEQLNELGPLVSFQEPA